jgi:hypothetical protein
MEQNNYNQIKQESLNGNITDKLFPYLWEYYEDIPKSKKEITNYQDFVNTYNLYLNTQILNNNQILQPVQELINKLPDIFKHLDEKYKTKKEPTEK